MNSNLSQPPTPENLICVSSREHLGQTVPYRRLKWAFRGFSRPDGTQPRRPADPALKRWAILNNPLRDRRAIFIGGGDLEKVMRHFHGNASLGSHGYCALGNNRGHLWPFEKPTIDSRGESIVATYAFFIDRVDLFRSRALFLEQQYPILLLRRMVCARSLFLCWRFPSGPRIEPLRPQVLQHHASL